ncbi:MAG TPA: CARDB domain-containing protein [Solirubrobacterales bacterium]
MEDFTSRRPPRRPRPKRRPERQQIMLRRGLALGGGLIVVILIVLGIKGCLDARAEQAMTNYARDVTQIVQSTEQTSKDLFKKLEEPGSMSVTDFVTAVKADRSAIDTATARVDGLSAPGDMGRAQNGLELVYELRSSAMDEIAEKMSTALGSAGAAKATAQIAHQMQKLLSSDVLYEEVVRPEINGVLASNGIDGSDVPKSSFLPKGEETKWLEESTVAGALGSISGATGTATPGVHGLGLAGVSVNGTELLEGGVTSVLSEETPEVEIQVQNQGESTENGINVSVTVNGNTLAGKIDALPAGETETVVIPLTPAPKGEATLEVEVEAVPGEQLTENNEASYTVVFE